MDYKWEHKHALHENCHHNIQVSSGVNSGKTVFSCTGDGTKVDLWTHDDNSGRQAWTFRHLGNNVYNIFVGGGTQGGRVYLSCVSDGTKVDLWTQDDGSGRQRWLITPTGAKWGEYHIRAAGGVGNRAYLSTTDDGSKVDLWTHDDNSGRQKWVLNAKAVLQENRDYNIYVSNGVSGGRTMFSCTDDGSKVDLWTKDDNSGRQVYRFKHLGSNCYNIMVAGGTKGGRTLLSCTDNGEKVDLWTQDDGSGRQKWVMIPVMGGKGNEYNIRVAGGMKTDRVLLSCTGDGTTVDLWKADDASGRQRWVIVPK